MEKNVRLRLLLVMEMLIECTDENHGLSMQDILRKLEENGIAGERKSIYEDIHALQRYGLDIEYNREEKTYKVINRIVNTKEVSIIIKALQNYNEIDEDTADEIISHVLNYLSVYEREEIGLLYRRKLDTCCQAMRQ